MIFAIHSVVHVVTCVFVCSVGEEGLIKSVSLLICLIMPAG